jgi:hypothetical protein
MLNPQQELQVTETLQYMQDALVKVITLTGLLHVL